MPLWGTTANTTNAPKNKSIVGKTGANQYGNTTVSAAVSTVVKGVYGVDAANVSARSYPGLRAPGWVESTHFTGAVVDLKVAGGTTYTNADTIKISGGITNATANLVTNGSGVPTGYANLVGGTGFSNVSSLTVTVTSTGGTNVAITPVLGGRAGRVQHESLVVIHSMTGDGSKLPPKA